MSSTLPLVIFLFYIFFATTSCATPEKVNLSVGRIRQWASIYCTPDLKECITIYKGNPPVKYSLTMAYHHILSLETFSPFWNNVLLKPTYATQFKKLAEKEGFWYQYDKELLRQYDPAVPTAFAKIAKGEIVHDPLSTNKPDWLEALTGYVSYPRGDLFVGPEGSTRCDDPGSGFEVGIVVIANSQAESAKYYDLNDDMIACTKKDTPACVTSVVDNMISLFNLRAFYEVVASKWSKNAAGKWCIAQAGKCWNTQKCGSKMLRTAADEQDAKIRAYVTLAKVLEKLELEGISTDDIAGEYPPEDVTTPTTEHEDPSGECTGKLCEVEA